jgi:hypothetical protein
MMIQKTALRYPLLNLGSICSLLATRDPISNFVIDIGALEQTFCRQQKQSGDDNADQQDRDRSYQIRNKGAEILDNPPEHSLFQSRLPLVEPGATRWSRACAKIGCAWNGTPTPTIWTILSQVSFMVFLLALFSNFMRLQHGTCDYRAR